jgi:hypothetical protein
MPFLRSIHADSPATVKLPGTRKTASGALQRAVITMQSSLADLLDAWHDFDLLIGTAAAIRNAWDMMLWIVIRAPAPNAGDRDGM